MPLTSAAQPRPEAVRAGLLAQAHDAVEAGDHVRALDLLRAAFRIGPTVALRHVIAFEAFQTHDAAVARAEATACVAEADEAARHGDNTSDTHIAAAQCAEMLTRLRPAVPSVETTVPAVHLEESQPHDARAVTPAVPSAVHGESRAGPVTLFVVGGVALAATAVFWSLRSAVLAPCAVSGDLATCPTGADRDQASHAPLYAMAGNVSAAVGLGALAGGAIWWALGSRRPEATHVAIGPGTVGLAGTF